MTTLDNLSVLQRRTHPTTVGKQAIAEIKVLYLDLILTCCYGINDVLMLADGGKGRIILDPYSHVLPNMQSKAAKAMEDVLT